MNEHELTKLLENLFTVYRKQLISPTGGIVFRAGGIMVKPAEDFEAGDIVIIPPSLITTKSPTQGYILGCVEKCWPQIKERIQ